MRRNEESYEEESNLKIDEKWKLIEQWDQDQDQEKWENLKGKKLRNKWQKDFLRKSEESYE